VRSVYRQTRVYGQIVVDNDSARVLEDVWCEGGIEIRSRLFTRKPVESVLEWSQLHNGAGFSVLRRGYWLRDITRLEAISVHLDGQSGDYSIVLVDGVPACPLSEREKS
jgi:hypothetical protein